MKACELDRLKQLEVDYSLPPYTSKYRMHDKNKYIILKDYVLILTPVRALLDKEDLYLLKFRYFAPHGSKESRNYYLRCYYAGKRYMLHDLVMHNTGGMIVDHINGNTMDNRKCNLRLCTREENARNRKPNKGRKLPKGVRYYKANTNRPYVAFIYINKKEKNLGAFKTVEEALQVRLEAEKKYYGEFRRKEVEHSVE